MRVDRDSAALETDAMTQPAVYFNEFDGFASQWLRNLFPTARIDDRSITDVQAQDTEGFDRCHFFGGIGGWEYALQLAGWPTEIPVWTGSCPCQPFSAAGKKKGTADDRHLWPEMRRLIDQCRPAVVFGEQVASPLGRQWLAGVRADLEGMGYAVGAADLCAPSVGAPHQRQRLYWVAYSGLAEFGRRPASAGKNGTLLHAADRCGNGRMADVPQNGRRQGGPHIGGCDCGIRAEGSVSEPSQAIQAEGRLLSGSGDAGGITELQQLANTVCEGWTSVGTEQERIGSGNIPGNQRGPSGAWSDFYTINCRDGKTRRVGSGLFPLAHGIPNRVGRLRGYGNAIVPQVAAEFIVAFCEAVGINTR